MKFIFVPMTACVALTGCVAPPMPRTPNYVLEPFNASQAEEMLKPGTATIKANAFMRQSGGGVVTCAGSDAYLIPATDHAKQRVMSIYGSEQPAGRRAMHVTFTAEDPRYWTLTKRTKCDSKGEFTFKQVGPGSYYIATAVTWVVMNTQQGGPITELVQVKDGDQLELVLSR